MLAEDALLRSSGADGKGTFGGVVRTGLLTIKIHRCLSGSTAHTVTSRVSEMPRAAVEMSLAQLLRQRALEDRTVSKVRKLAETQLSPRLPSNPRPTFPITGLR